MSWQGKCKQSLGLLCMAALSLSALPPEQEQGTLYSLLELSRQLTQLAPARQKAKALEFLKRERDRFVRPSGGVLDCYLEAALPAAAGPAAFLPQGVPAAGQLPEEAGSRLLEMAEGIEQASGGAGPIAPGDRAALEALALLARYHARKLVAEASLSRFYATGDETALQAAEAGTAAALDLWEQLVSLAEGVRRENEHLSAEDVKHLQNGLPFARADVERIKEVRALFKRYGLFDLGLDFGPAAVARGGARGAGCASSYFVERRFRPLDPEMTYSSDRTYGWRMADGIKSSAPAQIPAALYEGEYIEGQTLPRGVLYRDYLRSERQSDLLIDLPDGEYRVTVIVGNTPELAGGSFRIRAEGAGRKTAAIVYRAAESGDKSMDVHITGGRLVLEFMPEAGEDWLVAGLVITKHAPHIAHIPLRIAAAGSTTSLTATITAPDGVRAASIVETVPGGSKPVIVEMAKDETQFRAAISWRRDWAGKEVRYHIVAADGAGRVGRLPAKGEFVVQVAR